MVFEVPATSALRGTTLTPFTGTAGATRAPTKCRLPSITSRSLGCPRLTAHRQLHACPHARTAGRQSGGTSIATPTRPSLWFALPRKLHRRLWRARRVTTERNSFRAPTCELRWQQRFPAQTALPSLPPLRILMAPGSLTLDAVPMMDHLQSAWGMTWSRVQQPTRAKAERNHHEVGRPPGTPLLRCSVKRSASDLSQASCKHHKLETKG